VAVHAALALVHLAPRELEGGERHEPLDLRVHLRAQHRIGHQSPMVPASTTTAVTTENAIGFE
jgi:hypothetical protein